jgi:Xaa-Pro dipeptidase
MEGVRVGESIISKVERALDCASFDGILVLGYDNVQYLTGAHLHYPPSFPDRPMALLWPKGATPVCVLPALWEESFRKLAWKGETHAFEERGTADTVIDAIARVTLDTVGPTGTIGMDTRRVATSTFSGLARALEGFELVPCDEWLAGLRMVKTDAEIECLEEVARDTDHGLNGAAHHILVTSVGTEIGEGESIRIHAIERGLDEVGHHAIAQAIAGVSARKFWPNAPRYGVGSARKGKPQELMRMELNASRNGYWSSGARMLVLGNPDDRQRAAYATLVELREAAHAHLRPGVTAAEVHAAVSNAATAAGAKLVTELPVGHGIGVTPRERPYLSAGDQTVLAPSMVLVVSPTIIGPDGELMMGKDTFVITDTGARLVGWYKDWREPFVANYSF